MLAGLSNPKSFQTYVEARRFSNALSFSFSPFRGNLTGRDHADGTRGRKTTAACRGEQQELRQAKGPIG